MQTKFSNDMVAHVWANQSQEYGQSNNGNFYFQGRVLYSYGSHYIVGIIAHDGRAILNSDSSTMTTSGKHKPAAWWAVRGRESFSIPSLTGIYRAILSATSPADYAGQWMNPETAKRELRAYLDAHGLELSAEAGAYLYGLFSRGDWSKERARLESKASKAKERAERRAKAALRAEAAQWAAMPLAAFRARLAAIAGNDSEYARQRQFAEITGSLYHAHRGAGGARIKAAVWERLKIARAFVERDKRRGEGFRALRKAIATLRQIQSGDVRGLSWRTIRQPGAWEALDSALCCILGSAPAVRPSLRAKLQSYQQRAERVLEAAKRRAHRIEQAERARRAAEQFARDAEKRRAWLAGESVGYFHGSDAQGGALLRAVDVELDGCNVRGGTLQTSWGAHVPLAHAVRAFRFVKAVRESGRAWEAAGRTIRVGHFGIDRIEATGDFRAGCHVINWPEIERLALELGVFDCPATGEAEALETAERV